MFSSFNVTLLLLPGHGDRSQFCTSVSIPFTHEGTGDVQSLVRVLDAPAPQDSVHGPNDVHLSRIKMMILKVSISLSYQ